MLERSCYQAAHRHSKRSIVWVDVRLEDNSSFSLTIPTLLSDRVEDLSMGLTGSSCLHQARTLIRVISNHSSKSLCLSWDHVWYHSNSTSFSFQRLQWEADVPLSCSLYNPYLKLWTFMVCRDAFESYHYTFYSACKKKNVFKSRSANPSHLCCPCGVCCSHTLLFWFLGPLSDIWCPWSLRCL